MPNIIHFRSYLARRQARVKYIRCKGTNQAIVLAGLGTEGGSFGFLETRESQDVADGGKLELPFNTEVSKVLGLIM